MFKRQAYGPEGRSGPLLLLGMTGLFVAVHALYYRAGVRFQGETLPDYWQFLDQELLRTRLLESVLYLHSQPPLFNLLLGLVLKVTEHPVPVLNGLYLGMGLALYLGLSALMRGLGVSRGVAAGVATAFLVSPSFILYEHWLYYTFPVALGLVVAALCLARLLRTGARGAIAGFVVCLFALCGTWSLFHLLYFLLVIAVAAWLRRASARRLIVTAALPLLLVLGVYVKNQVLFGQFTASTWLGMNFFALTGDQTSLELRRKLVAEGQLSPVSLIPRFSELERYPAVYQQTAGDVSVPALAALRKENGRVNFNHRSYVVISAQYLRDALRLLRLEPKAVLRGLSGAWAIYFRSATDYPFLRAQPIAAWNEGWDRFVYGRVSLSAPMRQGFGSGHPVFLSLWLGLPALLVYGVRLALGRGPGRALSPEQRATLLFLCGNILYVAAVGNLFELGENNRFRFATDPFYAALLGLFLQHTVRPALSRWGVSLRAARASRARRAPSPSARA